MLLIVSILRYDCGVWTTVCFLNSGKDELHSVFHCHMTQKPLHVHIFPFLLSSYCPVYSGLNFLSLSWFVSSLRLTWKI